MLSSDGDQERRQSQINNGVNNSNSESENDVNADIATNETKDSSLDSMFNGLVLSSTKVESEKDDTSSGSVYSFQTPPDLMDRMKALFKSKP